MPQDEAHKGHSPRSLGSENLQSMSLLPEICRTEPRKGTEEGGLGLGGQGRE